MIEHALQMQMQGRLCPARDVVLMSAGEMPEFRIYQEHHEYDYQVFEFFRFNQDGSKRLAFPLFYRAFTNTCGARRMSADVRLLADAEAGEDSAQQVVAGEFAGDFV